MKKNVVFSAILSLILTSIGLLTNLICSLAFKFAPLTFPISGGDSKIHTGFGIDFIEIFSLSPNGGNSTTFNFNLISLIVSFAIIFVIVLIIKTIVSKKNK